MIDKIRYILDLNNIRMPSEIRDAALEDTVKEEKQENKKRRVWLVAVIVAVALAVVSALLFAVVTVIKNHKNSDVDPGAVVPGIPADTARTDETTVPSVPGVQDDTIYRFSALNPVAGMHYGYFKLIISQVNISDNAVLYVPEDTTDLQLLFGQNKQSKDIDAICETVFAFYEPGCIRYIDSISDYSTDEAKRIKDLSEKDAIMRSAGLMPYNEILMSTKFGTFEYLLTCHFYLDGSNNVFNSDRVYLGTMEDGALRLRADSIGLSEMTVYKIRVENSIPVIYDCTVVDSMYLHQSALPEFDEAPMTQSGIGTYLNDTLYGLYTSDIAKVRTVSSAIFPCAYGAVKLTNSTTPTENTSKQICDYPYSMPVKRGKVYCDIINRYGLQWFFPMFETDNGDGSMTIIGDAITGGKRVLTMPSLISAAMVPLAFVTPSMTDEYYRYHSLSSYSSGMISDSPQSYERVDLYYSPNYTDRPFFNASYFDGGDLLTAVTVKSGGEMYENAILKKEVIETMKTSYAAEPVNVLYTGEFLYVKDKDFRNYPQRPLSADLLAFIKPEELGDGLFDMYESLGTEPEHPGYIRILNGEDRLSIGHRTVSVFSKQEQTYYKENGLTEFELEAGVTNKRVVVLSAFEQLSEYGCLIDIAGRAFGFMRGDGTMLFFNNGFEPDLGITVTSSDGKLLSVMNSGAEAAHANEFSGFYRYKKENGIMLGSAALFLKRADDLTPVYEAYGQDGDIYVVSPVIEAWKKLPLRLQDSSDIYYYNIPDESGFNSFCVMSFGIKSFYINMIRDVTEFKVSYNKNLDALVYSIVES